MIKEIIRRKLKLYGWGLFTAAMWLWMHGCGAVVKRYESKYESEVMRDMDRSALGFAVLAVAFIWVVANAGLLWQIICILLSPFKKKPEE